jgi:ubiquitin carboxyl-terminal hydrolase 7
LHFGQSEIIFSLLESIFGLPQAVYQIPTEHDGPDSVALTLQRIFYELQTSDKAVGIADLTKSLVWKSLDVSQSHNLLEFTRVLQHKLQNRTKNTPADGTIQYLFAGKHKRYIKCTHVDYESSQEETFFGGLLLMTTCMIPPA